MPTKNIRLDMQYNGADFSGWQFQPDVRTIQGEIEGAIKKVTGQDVRLHAAGRTDAGVHALGQVANFKIDHYLPVGKYRDALNFYLPQTILIRASAEVPDEFDARKSALWRHYRYIIGLERSALYHNLRWEIPYQLNMERMNEIAESIRGIHDFTAFCVVNSQKENNECDVHISQWQREESQLVFDIRANRFLHTMVRSLVGLMVETGKDKDYLTLIEFRDILQSGDHTRIRMVAPTRGLYLVAVGY